MIKVKEKYNLFLSGLCEKLCTLFSVNFFTAKSAKKNTKREQRIYGSIKQIKL